MHQELLPEINQTIKRTKRAIISLGCSFVHGQGAIDESIYHKYPWVSRPNPTAQGYFRLRWSMEEKQKKKLVEEYPDIILWPNGELDFHMHEYAHAFNSVLCKKYFNNEYASINLGRRGNGNRAAIKELYFYPEILWDELEEIIVIYVPSGAERFDFMDDIYCDLNKHGRWVSMWPNTTDNNAGSRNKLWSGYKESLYSKRFEVLEQIANIQELLLWCKYKNAKLIITPGFMRYYTKRSFAESLQEQPTRSETREFLDSTTIKLDDSIINLVKMWPWDNMFYPGGYPTFVDLLMAQEFSDWKTRTTFYEFMGKGSPGGWITPCAHPAAKGHDLFAKHLYKHITENL